MQIVIEMSDEYYEILKYEGQQPNAHMFSKLVANGTSLPKGHGAIIDIKQIHRVEIEDSYTGRKMIWDNNPKINDTTYYLTAPVIIEADRSEE